jgi:DNA-directed RNA polymerase specialized sigma24 family protein
MEAVMTNYHEFYDNRIGEVENLMRMQWQDDEDVMQEARIGVYRALIRNPGAVAKYLFISGKHAAIAYLEKGKSVDNAKFSRYRQNKANGGRPRVLGKRGKETEEGQCKVCEFRTEEWDGLPDSSIPVDEQVIFMDSAEKFFNSLDEKERAFARLNIHGNADRLQSPSKRLQKSYRQRLADQMKVPVSKVLEIERSMRTKWDLAFNE